MQSSEPASSASVTRIGTRGSPLALAQANEVRDRLASAHRIDPARIAIKIIKTTGDAILDRPLSEAGGKGLFTKEIEQALIDNEIDLAVHSAKDVPTFLPDELWLSAWLPREDVRDAFISPRAKTLAALPSGAVVGTASLRRQAMVLRLRPDLKVVNFRGNVQTRLRKLEEGVAEGTILALAGLRRLGQQHVASEIMDLEAFPPAPGQGAIGIESRTGDRRTSDLLAAIHDVPTGQALACERAFLGALDGSCRMPIAGHATVQGGTLAFKGLVIKPDGSEEHGVTASGPAEDAAAMGARAGAEVRAKAGPAFFEGWA